MKDIIQDIFIYSFAYLIAICTYKTIKDFIIFLRNKIDQIVNRKKYRWFKNIKITGTVDFWVRKYGMNNDVLSWMDVNGANGENYALYKFTDKKSLYVGNILLLGNVSDEEIKTFIEKKLKYKFRHFLNYVELKKKATKIIDYENGKIEWEIK